MLNWEELTHAGLRHSSYRSCRVRASVGIRHKENLNFIIKYAEEVGETLGLENLQEFNGTIVNLA